MGKNLISTKEMVERFLYVEKAHSLFDKSVNGYFFWPYMRFNVFSELQRVIMPLAESHPDFRYKKTTNDRCRCVGVLVHRFRRICDFFKYNPCFAVCKRPLLFALEPRIMPIGNRGAIPIMLDFFVD